MDHLGYPDRRIREFDERIEELMRSFQEAIERLTTMPGVGVSYHFTDALPLVMLSTPLQ